MSFVNCYVAILWTFAIARRRGFLHSLQAGIFPTSEGIVSYVRSSFSAHYLNDLPLKEVKNTLPLSHYLFYENQLCKDLSELLLYISCHLKAVTGQKKMDTVFIILFICNLG